jgi:anti-anti-sigma regulatory factor
MTIRITQIENETDDRTTLRLEGKLLAADAEIVEQVFDAINGQSPEGIDIDLSRISFINSDSASVLKQLESRGAVLKGLDFFTRQVIETYEIDQINKDKKE